MSLKESAERLMAIVAAGEAELKVFMEEVQNPTALVCAFCGEATPPGTENFHELMAAHIAVCEKHPLQGAFKEVTRLNTLLAVLVEAAIKVRRVFIEEHGPIFEPAKPLDAAMADLEEVLIAFQK